MTEVLQFAALGLGAGAAYALLAHGVVLIYRGSGIVNFSQGAMAMVAAYLCFVDLRDEREWALAPAFAASVVLAAAIGLLFQQVVLRLLAGAAPIVRLISTLGLLVVLQAAAELRWGSAAVRVDPLLPDHLYEVGGVTLQEDRLLLLGIAIVVTLLLWAGIRFTRIGLAITASASNERVVATLGWSPNLLAALTWSIGAALAGTAGILIAPQSGLTPSTFTLVVTVSALAAALLGGFRSFPLTLLGGLVLGIGESLVTLYQDDIKTALGLDTLTGANRALPFLVILVVLVVRGRSLPLRSHVADHLPRLGTGRGSWWTLAAAVAATAAVAPALDHGWSGALSVTLTAAILALSVVVLTGFAGQLSLAQYAVGGLGALFAAKLVSRGGLPFELAIPGGILLTVLVGVVLALPALRTRGVNLAVVTLGLGFTIQEVVFANPTLTGTALDGGTAIGRVTLFGIDVNALDHPERWSLVCLAGLVMAGLAVANLRRSRSGRRLVAVRTNERAAASLGINVLAVKIYAFAVAAAIAGLGGILLGFRNPTVTYAAFNVFASINAVGHAVIGGVGYTLGAVIGAPMVAGGLASRALEEGIGIGEWTALVSGVLLIVLLIVHPDGIADALLHALRPLRAHFRRAAAAPPKAAAATVERVAEATLEVSDLTVTFGGVVAVDGVRFSVAPGQVVGLIGPNGAGKTTVIDAVTGFVRPKSGSIVLAGNHIERASAAARATAGLRRSFQSLELFEDITVAENLLAACDQGRWFTRMTDLIRPGRHLLPATARAAVIEFKLGEHLDRRPTELSFGQRRLVAIARAAASGPSVLLLDEPASGLDETESRELARLIRRLADEWGMSVLLVEHDVEMVLSTCDHVVVVDFGRVIASGKPEDVRADAAVRVAYLGTSDTQAPPRTGPEGPLEKPTPEAVG